MFTATVTHAINTVHLAVSYTLHLHLHITRPYVTMPSWLPPVLQRNNAYDKCNVLKLFFVSSETA